LCSDSNERETVIKHLVSSAKPKDETLSLVLVKPGEPAATVRNVKQAGDLSGLLAEAIPKEGAPCRYAAFEQTVVLFLAPQEAEKKRSHAVAAFSDGYKAWVRDLKEADQKAGANAAAKKIASNTAEFFVLLNRQNLLDDRTQSYEALWTYGIAPAITADAKDATAALQLEQFGTNFVAAQNKDKCTVTVSTMPKPGATIHYAKAADAQRHVFTPHSLPTINTFEVERATYSFRVLRGGTQTGGVDGIKCTDPTQLVVIDEIP